MARIDIPDPEAGPTEPDEEQILGELYGEPDEGGSFRGEGRQP
ncbi:hypothetical protein [Actinomadura sp. 3N508]